MDYEYYITPEEYEEAERNGISYDVLTERIRKLGWGKRKAITTPVRPKKKYGHWIDIAKANGISYNTFYFRIYKSGWGVEEAATRPLVKDSYLLANKARRKLPVELVKIAEKNGISYNTLLKRIRVSKWDIQKAITTPIMTKREIGLLRKELIQRGKSVYYSGAIRDS